MSWSPWKPSFLMSFQLDLFCCVVKPKTFISETRGTVCPDTCIVIWGVIAAIFFGGSPRNSYWVGEHLRPARAACVVIRHFALLGRWPQPRVIHGFRGKNHRVTLTGKLNCSDARSVMVLNFSKAIHGPDSEKNRRPIRAGDWSNKLVIKVLFLFGVSLGCYIRPMWRQE